MLQIGRTGAAVSCGSQGRPEPVETGTAPALRSALPVVARPVVPGMECGHRYLRNAHGYSSSCTPEPLSWQCRAPAS